MEGRQNIPPGAIPIPMGPNGQMPSPQQIAAMQQQLAAEAQKHGMTVPQFVEHIKAQRIAQLQQAQRLQQQQQQQGGAPGQQQGGQQGQQGPQGPQPPPQAAPPQAQPQPQPIRPGPPNPVAIALANFLRGQTLKPRTCIINGERKDMFRGMLPPINQTRSRVKLTYPL